MRENITYLFVKSELGAGTWGASLGIEALQLAARNRESDILDRYPAVWLRHKFTDKETPTYAKNIGSLQKFYIQISDALVAITQDGRFPVVISGDHANAMGTVTGVTMAYPGEKIGLIWIDAHGDIHTPWTTPSGNVHGMPVAMALGLGKPTNLVVNKVAPNTAKLWQEILEMGGRNPKVLPEHVIYVGIRDLEDTEWDKIHELGIRYYTPMNLTEMGTHRVVDDALQRLQDCDRIVVSFDVDSIESEFFHGTGTPVPRGLSVAQAVSILKRIWKSPKLAAIEFTEVNPLLDNQNQTAEFVSQILEDVLETPVEQTTA